MNNYRDWHIQLGRRFRSNFELLAPITVNLVCFRYIEEGKSEEELNQINEQILKDINTSGKIYRTHTKLDGKYTLRWVGGHPDLTKAHVENAWKIITAFKP